MTQSGHRCLTEPTEVPHLQMHGRPSALGVGRGPEREPVQVTGDAERSLPDARRKVTGRSEG
jgi:hypothetical protein